MFGGDNSDKKRCEHEDADKVHMCVNVCIYAWATQLQGPLVDESGRRVEAPRQGIHAARGQHRVHFQVALRQNKQKGVAWLGDGGFVLSGSANERLSLMCLQPSLLLSLTPYLHRPHPLLSEE